VPAFVKKQQPTHSVIKTLGEKGVEDSQSGRRVERVTV